MSMMNRLKRLYWVYCSRPKSSRILYRAVSDLRATRIVEFGITDPERSLRLVQMAVGMHEDGTQVSYTAIDPFDARSNIQSPLSIKQAHRFFSGSGAKVQFVPVVPGSMSEGLARTANTLLGTDLVMFAEETAQPSDSRLWFYLPRLLHETSCVVQARSGEEGQESTFCKISREEIAQRATIHTRKRVA